MSIEITATFILWRLARLNSITACSKKYRQLYIPVNASVLAWFLNCSFNWDNSVTSV